MPPAFHTSMMNVYEKYNDILIWSALLFVCGTAHVKSISVERDVDQEPLVFVRSIARVQSIRVERDIDFESFAF
jgi:hypothetical protein